MLGSLAKKIFGTANARRPEDLYAEGGRHQRPGTRCRGLERHGPRRPGPSSYGRNSPQASRSTTFWFRLSRRFGRLPSGFSGSATSMSSCWGGMVLHEGGISEMRTGEGKTLVATLATYLNALPSAGVHVVTVNDYLARRGRRMDGPRLQVPGPERRHHRAWARRQRAQRGLCGRYHLRHQQRIRLRLPSRQYEVRVGPDGPSAATPMRSSTRSIRSWSTKPGRRSSSRVRRTTCPISTTASTSSSRTSMQGDYDVDEKQRTANLTEAGNEHIETLLAEAGLLTEGSLYEAANATLVHHVQQGLKAHKLFARDKDYIVRNGEVVIIDEFSGRMMPGRLAIRKASIRRSKPRKAYRSSPRTSRWPRSPSRTISASTRSSPA